MDESKEYSSEFDRLRRNRVLTSYHKYGSAEINYGQGLVSALGSMEKCIEKYNDSGNTEYLLDAANYVMFEFMYPQKPGAYFKATSDSDSAGVVGKPINNIDGLNY